MPTLHAFDCLKQPLAWDEQALIVLFGDESFLKRELLHQLAGDYEQRGGFPAASYDGQTCEWRDVADEVATVSLFGGGLRRVAIVDPADRFVTDHRSRIEDYLEAANTHGCLILCVQQWAANTRLYKAADTHALQIECRAPLENRRGSKAVDEARICKWLVDWCQARYQRKLHPEAAQSLLDLVGPELGVLDQDLSKLSLFAKPNQTIDRDLVDQAVGGWRQKTVWEIIDAGLDGQVAEAVGQLDHLLQSGEAAPALFAQISWAMRRFALATDLYGRELRNRQRVSLETLLKQAGFRDWPKGSLKTNEQRLIKLGRERARLLHRWLLETDLALKGTHSAPHRARVALESLFMKMAQSLPTSKSAH